MQEQILQLESQLTGDMMADMEIRQKIHELKLEHSGGSCSIDNPQCENCGA